MKNIVILTIFLLFLLGPSYASAVSIGTVLDFNINTSHDLSGRTEISAVLVKISPKLYFYVEEGWWDSLNSFRKSEVRGAMNILTFEFENVIKPTLNEVFGSEWSPGVDGDERITILVHRMREGVGGYVTTADEFLKLQLPTSNEREMIYMSSGQIEGAMAKSFLAHEFTHLITFNQKDRLKGAPEDVWLNEARAEYAPTLLGYNNPYVGSNLEIRVNDFIEKPGDSLVEWLNQKYDYAGVSLFAHYLVDQYSVQILIDSLHSEKTGVAALNEALLENGFSTTFQEIFTDWTIALFLSDCTYGTRYCYLNQDLEDLRLNPGVNFLPLSGESSLAVSYVTKNWTGNWQKFIGGRGEFTLEFSSLKGLNFTVPYLLQKLDGSYVLDTLVLGEEQTGTISIPEFGTTYKALIVIPSLQSKTTGFNGFEPTFPFSLTTSLVNNEQDEIAILLERIALLQTEILRLQIQLVALNSGSPSCTSFATDLSFGLGSNKDVECLQRVLAKEVPNAYPVGLVTGNFFTITRQGVVAFQEKYSIEILFPLGLEKGTGYVGPSTRNMLNSILRSSPLTRE